MVIVEKDDNFLFREKRIENIKSMTSDNKIKKITKDWLVQASNFMYSYNFDWLGAPIIQFPQDIIAIQEIVWNTRPDIIIETGIARGGSLIFSASMLHLLNGDGRIIGIDIDIRPHNRKIIESHPLAFRIELLQGSSIDLEVINQVRKYIKPDDKVMVILDSNHTHNHVLKELEYYGDLVTTECYLIAMDTIVDDMPDNYYPDRPWGKGNNPKTAVDEFLKQTDRFQVDELIHNKLLITNTPSGYLKCIK